jgi:hypothetical protein
MIEHVYQFVQSTSSLIHRRSKRVNLRHTPSIYWVVSVLQHFFSYEHIADIQAIESQSHMRELFHHFPIFGVGNTAHPRNDVCKVLMPWRTSILLVPFQHWRTEAVLTTTHPFSKMTLSIESNSKSFYEKIVLSKQYTYMNILIIHSEKEVQGLPPRQTGIVWSINLAVLTI